MGIVKWTIEKCKASAANYSTRGDWVRGDPKAYGAAQRNYWIDQCCTHMKAQRETWTLTKCKASAFKYETRSEWKKMSRMHMP